MKLSDIRHYIEHVGIANDELESDGTIQYLLTDIDEKIQLFGDEVTAEDIANLVVESTYIHKRRNE